MIGDVRYKKIETEFGTLVVRITETDGIHKGEILDSHTKLCVFAEKYDDCILLAEHAFYVSLDLWLKSELNEIWSCLG